MSLLDAVVVLASLAFLAWLSLKSGPRDGIGLALLSAFLALPAQAQEPSGPAYDWGSWSYSQYLAKAGQDRKAIFGARLTGWMYQGKLTVAGDLDVSATQDGGATEGSVSVLDPKTFQVAAGTLVAYYDLVKLGQLRVSAAAIGGLQVDVEGGRIKPRERYPVTAAAGVRLGYRGAAAFLVGGKHDAAGPGFKVGGSLQIPLEGRTSLIARGAFPGPLSYVMGGIALSLR